MAVGISNEPNPTVGTTGISVVGNDLQSNAVLIANHGTGVIEQSDNITTGGETVEMLAEATYLNASGSTVSTSGALVPVAFTTAGAGWYRILSIGGAAGLGGLVRIAVGVTAIEFQFAQPGGTGRVKGATAIDQTRFLNDTGGIVDQVRISEDGTGSVAVDIDIVAPSLQPMTLYYVGPNIPQSAVIASPMPGAIALSRAITIVGT
jgi:hypothetical protein